MYNYSVGAFDYGFCALIGALIIIHMVNDFRAYNKAEKLKAKKAKLPILWMK